MDKGTFNLRNRDKTIELITAQQVANAEFYNSIKQATPMLSELMLEKFKKFLSDDYFTDIERQTMLIKFFEEHTDNDILQDVLTHVRECDCKDDYTKLIMEWTYHNSDDIIKRNLAQVDGSGLYGTKQKNKLTKPPDMTDSFIQGILQLTMKLETDEDDDEEM